jgi:hypothetical protein
VLKAAYAIRVPLVLAVNTPTCVTVPYDAVAVGNSIAPLLVAKLPDTVNAAVCLAYAVPEVDTSVPLASSAGLLVNNARYQAVGLVTLVVVNT